MFKNKIEKNIKDLLAIISSSEFHKTMKEMNTIGARLLSFKTMVLKLLEL